MNYGTLKRRSHSVGNLPVLIDIGERAKKCYRPSLAIVIFERREGIAVRRWAFLLLFARGCSTAPLADLADFFKPGKIDPAARPPYGGVCQPSQVAPPGGIAVPALPPAFPGGAAPPAPVFPAPTAPGGTSPAPIMSVPGAPTSPNPNAPPAGLPAVRTGDPS